MKIFDLIARPYALFYNHQARQAKRHIPLLLDVLPATCLSVLDVGCGTGAMCQILHENGRIVEGCDRSKAMIKQAIRLTSTKIRYRLADVGEGLPYSDGSFDLTIASLVAHGMPSDQRMILYKEMQRVARHYVILLEYSQTRHWLTDIMEYLERGDYFSFIKVVDQELMSFFGNLTKIPVGEYAAWYIMEIK